MRLVLGAAIRRSQRTASRVCKGQQHSGLATGSVAADETSSYRRGADTLLEATLENAQVDNAMAAIGIAQNLRWRRTLHRK